MDVLTKAHTLLQQGELKLLSCRLLMQPFGMGKGITTCHTQYYSIKQAFHTGCNIEPKYHKAICLCRLFM